MVKCGNDLASGSGTGTAEIVVEIVVGAEVEIEIDVVGVGVENPGQAWVRPISFGRQEPLEWPSAPPPPILTPLLIRNPGRGRRSRKGQRGGRRVRGRSS